MEISFGSHYAYLAWKSKSSWIGFDWIIIHFTILYWLNSIGRSAPLKFFLKNGPSPASFPFIFRLFQTNFTTNYCEKCPSSISWWDSNPQPSDREPHPITTRPWLLPSCKVVCGKYNGGIVVSGRWVWILVLSPEQLNKDDQFWKSRWKQIGINSKVLFHKQILGSLLHGIKSPKQVYNFSQYLRSS